jgi:hypothetical protein
MGENVVSAVASLWSLHAEYREKYSVRYWLRFL